MQEYRRKDHEAMPTIEAAQLTSENVHELATWCGGQRVVEMDALDSTLKYVGINVPTFLGGNLRASEGFYIVKDSLGSFFVRKPGEFEDLYEAI